MKHPYKSITITLITCLALGLLGCEESFIPESIDKEGTLVIEGMITNKAGAHTVIVSQSVGYNNTYEKPPGLNNCRVSIECLDGPTIPLKNVGNGAYQTDSTVAGEEGKAYRVVVKTSDLKTYLSTFEKMHKTAAIDSFNAVNATVESMKGSTLVSQEGLQLQTSFNCNDSPALFRYEYELVYQKRYNYYLGSPPPSYFVAIPFNSKKTDYVGTINASVFNQGIVINDPLIFITKDQLEGKPNADYEIASYGVHAHVEIYSISEFGYKYWNEIKKQQETSGRIFDEAVTQITSNLSCVEDSSQNVLGYFGASALSEKNMFFYLSFNTHEIYTTAIDSFPEVDELMISDSFYDFWQWPPSLN